MSERAQALEAAKEAFFAGRMWNFGDATPEQHTKKRQAVELEWTSYRVSLDVAPETALPAPAGGVSPQPERLAQLQAHRACINEEHDPSQGKLSGFCVVCGVPWPCPIATPVEPVAAGEPPNDYIDIVFDGPPAHESGRFVEVENAQGASVRVGQWVHRPDGYWALRLPASLSPVEPTPEPPCPHCKLPRVLPEVCTPELNTVIEEQIAERWDVLNAGYEIGKQSEPAPPPPAPCVWREITAEVEKATAKFPTWPTDPLHALAVLGEEFGELTKAVVQQTYEPHKNAPGELRKEAIQTAAMALRFAMSLDTYETQPCEQHQQSATHQQGGHQP